MKIIKLSNCEVEIKEALTWGDSEKIQLAMAKAYKSVNDKLEFDYSGMFEAKYTLLECVITKVTTDGVLSKYSKDWMYGLSKEDGDLLYSEVEKLNKKKEDIKVI